MCPRVRGRIDRASQAKGLVVINMLEKPEVDLNDVAYAFASKRRFEVILGLYDRNMTQKHLTRMLSTDHSNMGRSLRQLIKWELVVRLSPGVRKGALYTISERGKKVMEYIKYLVRAYNDGEMLEPHKYEALITLAKYRIMVVESNFYAINWDRELNDQRQVAEGVVLPPQ